MNLEILSSIFKYCDVCRCTQGVTASIQFFFPKYRKIAIFNFDPKIFLFISFFGRKIQSHHLFNIPLVWFESSDLWMETIFLKIQKIIIIKFYSQFLSLFADFWPKNQTEIHFTTIEKSKKWLNYDIKKFGKVQYKICNVFSCHIWYIIK